MLATAVFPMLAAMAFTTGAPLAMVGLFVGRANASAAALDVLARVGIVVYALGWVGVGLSLLVVQPHEGVLGRAS